MNIKIHYLDGSKNIIKKLKKNKVKVNDLFINDVIYLIKKYDKFQN